MRLTQATTQSALTDVQFWLEKSPKLLLGPEQSYQIKFLQQSLPSQSSRNFFQSGSIFLLLTFTNGEEIQLIGGEYGGIYEAQAAFMQN